MTSTCNHCLKELSSKQALQRHQNTCKIYKDFQLQNELQIIRQQYEQQLRIKDNEIRSLKEQLSEFKTQLFEIVKHPK